MGTVDRAITENDGKMTSERLIHLIHAAGMATLMAMKHPSNAAAKREDKAYAELFAYVMGRKPTADELKQLVPS